MTTQNAQSVTEYEILTPQYLPAVKKVTSNQLTGTPTLLSQTVNTNNVAGANSGRNVYWLEVLNTVTTNGLTGGTSNSIMQYSHQGEMISSDIDVNGEERTQTWYSWGGFNRFGSPLFLYSVKTRTGAPAPVVSYTPNVIAYNAQGDLLSKETSENWVEMPIVANTYHPTTGVLLTTTISGTGLPTKTTTSEYDSKFRYATKNTNPLGQFASKTYDPRWGLVKTETDVAGLTTTYDYDGFGKLTNTLTPQGFNITTQYLWSYDGLYMPKRCYDVVTTVPSKPSTWDTYDVLGRKTVATQENYGDAAHRWVYTYNLTEYDTKGNVATSILLKIF